MKRKLRIWWRNFHDKHLQKRKLSFVSKFHHKHKGQYCWADCVAWAFNYSRFNPFRIDKSKSCEIESQTHETEMCYCGGWEKGKCWDLLSKPEQEKRLEEAELNKVSLGEHLPF